MGNGKKRSLSGKIGIGIEIIFAVWDIISRIRERRHRASGGSLQASAHSGGAPDELREGENLGEGPGEETSGRGKSEER